MAEETAQISYEDLAAIEDEFDEIDTQIIKHQYDISKPAYAKRAEAVAKIDKFWALVIEQAPPELDQFVSNEDSRIFAESLTSLEVTRPELERPNPGSPRSFVIRFAFKPNEDFEDTTLEKTFSYRRARDGWTGLVSEPVKIHWKKGKDLTEGLTDGAVELWEQRKKTGDMTGKGVPAYTALKKKVEQWNGQGTSFFTWFGWISGRRWVGAEESEQAYAAHKAKKEARKRGEALEEAQKPGAEVKDEEEDDDDGEDDSAVEVHEAGEEIAVTFAEDIWPGAIRLFTQAQEMEEMSDMDFEEDDDGEDDDDEDEPIDIRSLVQGKGKSSGRLSDVGPPSKKQKK